MSLKDTMNCEIRKQDGEALWASAANGRKGSSVRNASSGNDLKRCWKRKAMVSLVPSGVWLELKVA